METELLTSQLTAGYIAAALIQWFKAKAWCPLVNADTPRLNRWIAAATALIAAIGIHTTFDSADGVLMITGLTISGVTHSGWAWIQQYALQQFFYKSVVKNGIQNGKS